MVTNNLKNAIAAALLIGMAFVAPGRAATPGATSTETLTNTATSNSPVAAKKPAPKTPRQLFNAATRDLSGGRLDEAEVLLERALSSQQEALAGPALYNLGHVRFDQGIAELKKSPGGKPLAARARNLTGAGSDAIRRVDESIASDDVQKMVQAYLHGRGVRKEMKAATLAVTRALEVHRVALGKWRRASGDFKSAVELKSSDTDSAFNAEVVDRNIAKLVDSIREMQQNANAMSEKGRELADKLKQLKGRIPASDMPPGSAGDEEEDEQPLGQQPTQQEAPGKEGNEIPLSPDLAGWLLEGFRLDSDRRLPMSQQQGEARTRSGPTW